jgi:DNA polymerase I-like protein with 3'-5' exonuclease and polymerase domains
MEYLGVGFVGKECKRHKDLMEAKLRSLEKEAYALAGREFSLTSAMETGTALRYHPSPTSHFFSLSGSVLRF